jgi:malate synthase
MYDARRQRRSELLNNNNSLPKFLMENSPAKQGNWKVAPLPPRLLDRRIDLGDVSPANILHLRAALDADVQGVQVR